MASPHAPKLQILLTRRFWLGIGVFAFLTAFWLSSASYSVGCEHNRWTGVSPIHIDARGGGIANGCFSFGWSSQTKHLAPSDDYPDAWDYGFDREPGELNFFPKLFGELQERPDNYESANVVIVPLWILPLAWSVFWVTRMVRLSRKEQYAFSDDL